MKKLKVLLIVLMGVLFVAGCTSMPQKLSSVQSPDRYDELGESSCEKCSFLLFDVIPIGFNNTTKGVYDCVVASKNGDGLMNPTVRNKWYYGVIGSGYCTQISGTVIKYKH